MTTVAKAHCVDDETAKTVGQTAPFPHAQRNGLIQLYKEIG
jgi:hypothetical protein